MLKSAVKHTESSTTVGKEPETAGKFNNWYFHTMVTWKEVHCHLGCSPPGKYLGIYENTLDCYDCGCAPDL